MMALHDGCSNSDGDDDDDDDNNKKSSTVVCKEMAKHFYCPLNS
jgi:hypothetical protein